MEFQCEYTEHCSSGYTCEVVKIVKTLLASNFIHFTGKHIEGKTNDNVKLLKIENHPLDAFPRNLHESFLNLRFLSIISCGLEKVTKTDLIGLEDLEVLFLDGNNLTSLPDDLFTDMKKLRTIFFKNNKIERLSSKLLKPIENSLEYVSFLGNTKINNYFNIANKSLVLFMGLLDSLEPPLQET